METQPPPGRRLVVIGAGPSGLSAAWGAREAAEEAGRPLEVVVLEGRDVPGGRARSREIGGFVVEEGPNGFLDSEAALGHLIKASGLEDEVIRANAAAARRYLLKDGRPRELKPHPLHFARSGILSPLGLGRLLLEPLIPKGPGDETESIAAFAKRRLGGEARDRLMDPMVSGVFAGDPKALSLIHAFPRIAALEAAHGSLIHGAISTQRARKAKALPGPSGALTSFKGGVARFPQALAERGDFEIRYGARVLDIARGAEGGFDLRVDGAGASLHADGVILGGEAYSMAKVVEALSPSLSQALGSLVFPPLNVVALGYGPEAQGRVPPGFGLLAPRVERASLLGVLFESQVFHHRGPDGHLLLRVMVGGAQAPDLGLLAPEVVIALVKGELRRIFDLKAEPRVSHVAPWPRAIPQYDLAHGERIRQAEAALAELPGLEVAGNSLYGVAFARAVARGYEVGRRLGAALPGRDAQG